MKIIISVFERPSEERISIRYELLPSNENDGRVISISQFVQEILDKTDTADIQDLITSLPHVIRDEFCEAREWILSERITVELVKVEDEDVA